MRLEGLMLATIEPLSAVRSLQRELARWRTGAPVDAELAGVAERGARACRSAAASLVIVAGQLEDLRKEATP